jgi:HlyD family secretion protein
VTDIVFRKEALDARARMDALPDAMRVTDSYTRLTLLSIAAASLLSLLASAFVIVPIDVSGQGVLIDRSGELLVPVAATAEGYVDTLLAQPGERIDAGQPVARLRVPELETAVDRAARQITSLENELMTYDMLEKSEAESGAALRYQKSEDIRSRLVNLESRLVLLRQRRAAEQSLKAKGYSTEERVLQTEIAVQDVAGQIDAARTEAKGLQATALEEKGARRRARLQKLVALDQARSELATLQLNQLAQETLISPIGGVIAEIGASQGAFVANGQAVVNLVASDETKEPLSALIYVPLAAGKQIKPGSVVLLQPSLHVDSTHDRLKARVTDVSQTPVTATALKRSLGNEQLAAHATRDGPAFAVRVELERDAASHSGYTWTSGQDPDIELTRGTPLSAKITVERRSLLSLALPALKNMLGLTEEDSWTKSS